MSKINLNSLLDPNKVQSYISERMDFVSRNHIPPPVSIEIQPTSNCNFKCPWCSYHKRNEDKCELPIALIMQLAQYIKKYKVKGIYISGGGEPCTYRKIDKMIDFLSTNETSLALISNGTLLEKIENKLNLFSYLQLSLIYVQNKLVNSASLEFFLQKTKNCSSVPIIGAMFVISKYNYSNIFEAIEFCKKNKFDYCRFRFAINFESDFQLISQQVLDNLKNDANKIKIFEKESHYTNIYDLVFNQYEKVNYIPEKICVNLHCGLYAIVNPKGEVYTCISKVGNPLYSIGSLHENDFEQIWNGNKHMEIIRKLDNEYKDGFCCNSCRSHLYNKIAKSKYYNISNHMDFV